MIAVKAFLYGLLALAVILVFFWMTDSISILLPWVLVWGGSSLWVYFDARRIMGEQNGRTDLRSAEMWAALVFVAWGIFFFYYLIDRSSIKRRVAEYNRLPEEYRFPAVASPSIGKLGLVMLMVFGILLAIPALSWFLSDDYSSATDLTGAPVIDEYLLSSANGYDISGDEKLVVLASENKEGDLYLFDRRARRMIQLTQGAEYDVRPRFSPDGKSICYSSISKATGRSHLWAMNLRDREKRQITSGDVFDYAPSFDATGKRLVFTRSNEKHMEVSSVDGGETLVWSDSLICIKSINGGNVQTIKLPEWGFNIDNPVFTPGGEAILYSAMIFDMPGVPDYANFDTLLFKKRIDTGQAPRMLTRPEKRYKDKQTQYAIDVEVSRDGKKLAFVSGKRVPSIGCYGLSIMKSDGSNARLLRLSASETVTYVSPRFNAKGDSIYFIKIAKNNSLRKLHLPTNREEKVLDEAVFKNPANWQLKAMTKSQKADATVRPR